jgi:pyruvate kinase
MNPSTQVRKTKIVCTIGPSTASADRIKELIQAGMDVARLNFSHGSREDHRRTIHTIRRISAEVGKEVGILQDLGGPKIRLGQLNAPERKLQTGERVVLFPGETSQSDSIPVTYPYLMEDVVKGDRILMADGTVELAVTDVGEEGIVCTVIVGGVVQSRKGVNLPSTKLRIPAFTEKDRADLRVGLEEHVDFVSLSFIRSEDDLVEVREMVGHKDERPMLIGKIEKPQAVERFDEILVHVDGVMVARGDLGVEMPLEQVPMIQKTIIQRARHAGKPVITATQMLRSMMENPRPTRAEATDVANAILDGTDAVMLSDETAMGSYPMEAVAVLDRIARATEPYVEAAHFLNESTCETAVRNIASAISRAACGLALDLNAAAIIASTSSGSTARMVARFRPPCPVVALTSHVETLRQLSLSWGVMPHLVEAFADIEHMFATVRWWVVKSGIARKGERVIVTAGAPLGTKGATNLLKVVELTG